MSLYPEYDRLINGANFGEPVITKAVSFDKNGQPLTPRRDIRTKPTVTAVTKADQLNRR